MDVSILEVVTENSASIFVSQIKYCLLKINICFRYLHHLKKMNENKAHVESSVYSTYLIEEAATFFNCYFESDVGIGNTSVGRNDGGE